MGRKTKPFIDKKNSTTYSLVFRSAEQEADEPDGPGRVLMPVAAQQHAAPQPQQWDDQGYGGSDDFDEAEFADFQRSLNLYDDDDYNLTEEQRQEILALGFPDDGYNYLKHVRDLGPGRLGPARPAVPSQQPPAAAGASSSKAAAAPAPSTSKAATAAAGTEDFAGPSVFVPAPRFLPPSEDQKLVDARRLVVAHKVDDDAEAAKAARDVSAFARPTQLRAKSQRRGRRVKLLQEVEEVTESMAVVERREELQEAAAEGEDDWGDWLDEFVVTAAKDSGGAGAAAGKGRAAAHDDEDDEDDEDYEEDEEEEEDGVGAGRAGARGAAAGSSGRPPAPPGSIASTYWRPERQDRKAGLENIDATFDVIAEQYEDDDLGELDDDAEAAHVGGADISEYKDVLDEFLRENAEMEGRYCEQPSEAKPAAGKAKPAAHPVDNDGETEDGEEGEGDSRFEADEEDGEDEEDGDGEERGGARPPPVNNKVASLEERDPEVIQATRERIRKAAESGSKEDEDSWQETETTVVVCESEKWDCESVLSLRSNLENHPARIVEPQRRAGGKGGGLIKLSGKSGLPAGYVGLPAPVPEGDEEGEESEGHGEGASGSGSEDEGQQQGGAGVPMLRHKGETAEEKRARKAAAKEARRNSRAAKKEVKGMFKAEEKRQKKMVASKANLGSMIAIP